jgi:hypothetical protein
VLDVYDKNGWLTPPFDVSRFETIPSSGQVRAGSQPGELPALPAPVGAAATQQVQFNVADIGGHALPDVANPLAIPHGGFKLQYDPRTQALRLPDDRATNGMSYTEIAPTLPTAAQLQHAGPVPANLREYLKVPPAPTYVQDILDQAPKGDAFTRLQYLRNLYYKRLQAAGAGNPVRVSPQRVEDFMRGKPASPFEIVAGEVLLARWSGVPARLGYGYYSTTPAHGNVYSIRPVDGAVWLEAYFDHFGWVPIVGTPPKAQASLDTQLKKHDPSVQSSDLLDLKVYVPIKLSTYQLLFSIVRYWLIRALPVLLGLVLVGLFYPGLIKIARRAKRRRWANQRDLPERLAVAYAELRDAANDLNLGDITLTPLEFVAATEDDAEHRELAWLASRALWGDLARDLRVEDVDAAEEMAASVTKRIRQASPAMNRVVAFGSRASLRDPYCVQIPNLWPNWHPVRRVRKALGAVWRRASAPLRGRRLLRLPRLVTAALAMLGVSSCVAHGPVSSQAGQLPAHIIPVSASVLAVPDVTFREEPTAEAQYSHPGRAALVLPGKVWSIHQGAQTQADLQMAAFKPQYSARMPKVRRGVLLNIAQHNFQLTRLGDQKVYVANLPSEIVLLWFSPDGRYYELMDARPQFTSAESLFVSLLAYQQGTHSTTTVTAGVPQPDPRQGGDD